MKIISWNINGIRAVRGKTFDSFIAKENPDIICTQENKAQLKALKENQYQITGYKVFWAEALKAGYSGVGIWVKEDIKVLSVKIGIDIDKFDNEGRTIILETEDFYLINSYYPNGRDDLSRVDFKLEYSYEILKIANNLKTKKPVILTGDFNTAHHEIDLANPKTNIKNTGFLPIERKFLDELASHFFIDAFRYLKGNIQSVYSWWSYRGGAKSRNVGWRIDYFWLSQDLKDRIQDVSYVFNESSSDHCPVVLILK